MERSSRSIKLALIGTASVALIGSVLLSGGCDRRDEQDPSQPGYRGGRGGFFFIPRLGGWFGGGGMGMGRGGNVGGGMSATPSSRGGFGSTGSVGSGFGSGVGS